MAFAPNNESNTLVFFRVHHDKTLFASYKKYQI